MNRPMHQQCQTQPHISNANSNNSNKFVHAPKGRRKHIPLAHTQLAMSNASSNHSNKLIHAHQGRRSHGSVGPRRQIWLVAGSVLATTFAPRARCPQDTWARYRPGPHRDGDCGARVGGKACGQNEKAVVVPEFAPAVCDAVRSVCTYKNL